MKAKSIKSNRYSKRSDTPYSGVSSDWVVFDEVGKSPILNSMQSYFDQVKNMDMKEKNYSSSVKYLVDQIMGVQKELGSAVESGASNIQRYTYPPHTVKYYDSEDEVSRHFYRAAQSVYEIAKDEEAREAFRRMEEAKKKAIEEREQTEKHLRELPGFGMF